MNKSDQKGWYIIAYGPGGGRERRYNIDCSHKLKEQYYLSLKNYGLENSLTLTRKSANKTEVFKSDHQIACKSLALTAETTHIPIFVKNIFFPPQCKDFI